MRQVIKDGGGEPNFAVQEGISNIQVLIAAYFKHMEYCGG